MKNFRKTLFLVLFCVNACFAQKKSLEKEENTENFLLGFLLKCSKTKDLRNCLKLKVVDILQELVRMKEPLVITEYLSLVKDPNISDTYYQELFETETSLEENSSETEEEKSKNLDKVIWNRLITFFKTRTIQLSLPSEILEGRGKEDKIFKKGQGVFLMAAMMGGMMMKMALGKIALIAAKALILGKIALVLSLIISLKKFASNAGGHPEVVYTSSENGSGRNFRGDSDCVEDGNDLAYNAHKSEILKRF